LQANARHLTGAPFTTPSCLPQAMEVAAMCVAYDCAGTQEVLWRAFNPLTHFGRKNALRRIDQGKAPYARMRQNNRGVESNGWTVRCKQYHFCPVHTHTRARAHTHTHQRTHGASTHVHAHTPAKYHRTRTCVQSLLFTCRSAFCSHFRCFPCWTIVGSPDQRVRGTFWVC